MDEKGEEKHARSDDGGRRKEHEEKNISFQSRIWFNHEEWTSRPIKILACGFPDDVQTCFLGTQSNQSSERRLHQFSDQTARQNMAPSIFYYFADKRRRAIRNAR